MTLSTYKMFALVVLMNLCIGFVLDITNDNDPDRGDITIEIDLLESEEKEVYSDTGLFGTLTSTKNQIYESTIGNTAIWDKSLLDVLSRGFNPLSIHPLQYETKAEQWVASMIMLFRSIMNGYIFILLLFIIKNKATT